MKLKIKHRIKTVLTAAVCGILLLTLILYTGAKQKSRFVSDLKIEIVDQQDNYFIDQFEVAALINKENTDYVLGLHIGELELKELEARVETNAFVKDAQVFHDLKGNLNVRLEQATPLARILGNRIEDRYVDEYGNLLPLNTQHTARVPVIAFEKYPEWKESIKEDEFGTDLLNMLLAIHTDPFWQAQVAFMEVDKKQEITLLTQVGKQEVIFGDLEDVNEKFKKLKVFYKEVLPAKGWNTYKTVNVKYKNQIVCK